MAVAAPRKVINRRVRYETELAAQKKEGHPFFPYAMFVVFSNRCMHLGCPVAATSLGFACPCHGGQYNKLGQRIAGPPIRPLDRYQWEVRAGGKELWLTNRWSVDFVNGKIKYFEVKMPGQPVDMPGPSWLPNILYPRVTYKYPHGSSPIK